MPENAATRGRADGSVPLVLGNAKIVGSSRFPRGKN